MEKSKINYNDSWFTCNYIDYEDSWFTCKHIQSIDDFFCDCEVCIVDLKKSSGLDDKEFIQKYLKNINKDSTDV